MDELIDLIKKLEDDGAIVVCGHMQGKEFVSIDIKAYKSSEAFDKINEYINGKKREIDEYLQSRKIT